MDLYVLTKNDFVRGISQVNILGLYLSDRRLCRFALWSRTFLANFTEIAFVPAITAPTNLLILFNR